MVLVTAVDARLVSSDGVCRSRLSGNETFRTLINDIIDIKNSAVHKELSKVAATDEVVRSCHDEIDILHPLLQTTLHYNCLPIPTQLFRSKDKS
ncbi:hypothetical protein J6590_024315 [Homalodisca vitripennis]|nr:hypothetical protein J6590_024315 [Homalodisca vitripennis]